MKAFLAKESVQWAIAAFLVAGGMAILIYGPSQQSAKAQMRAADMQPQAEGCQ